MPKINKCLHDLFSAHSLFEQQVNYRFIPLYNYILCFEYSSTKNFERENPESEAF